jgi:hypothetical protein
LRILCPSQPAHQISAATAIAAFAGYSWILQWRWPLKERDEALTVGSVWAALTVAFEFAFGRLVATKSWSDSRLIRHTSPSVMGLTTTAGSGSSARYV